MKEFDEVFNDIWNSIGGPYNRYDQFEQGTWNRQLVRQVAKEYAKLAIEEQLVLVEQEAEADSPYHEVDEESIRNCTRVELK